MKNYAVFFDFDGTVTKKDVIDELLANFASSNKWQAFENAWKSGKIGSKECLEGQVSTLKFAKGELNEFLSKVEIDPHFKEIVGFLKKNNIETAILSDGFDYFIKAVLRYNKIGPIKVRSNKIKINLNRPSTEFPHFNEDCPKCGHCKRDSMKALGNHGRKTIYIGDGLSDLCAARHADVVFAKKSLANLCKANSINHIAFEDLSELLNYLRNLKKNAKLN